VSIRSEALAARIEEGAASLAAFAEGLSEAEWRTPVGNTPGKDRRPVGVVVHQAQQFDLVVIGVSEEWGLESHLFGWRPERIARDCPCSLLIVRRYEGQMPQPVEVNIPPTPAGPVIPETPPVGQH